MLDAQIDQLQSVVDAATKVLKRNDADIGADVDELHTDVRSLNGLDASIANSMTGLQTQITTYQRANDGRIDALEQRIAQLETGMPSPNSSPDELWRLGSEAFNNRRYTDAIEIFGRLTSRWPAYPRAADAVYFEGQSYSDLHDWDHAIGMYETLLRTFPTSMLADDGLYLAAEAAENLKNCTDARAYLGLIKKNYPKSNVLSEAAHLDTTLRRVLRDKSKCRP
ncbi:MAG TPA: tetratricopeptide repeat protein [Kofleriaceae bacterium]|nr:tetratricopeptide repeat protein [Kofleriaceae bacterium]